MTTRNESTGRAAAPTTGLRAAGASRSRLMLGTALGCSLMVFVAAGPAAATTAATPTSPAARQAFMRPAVEQVFAVAAAPVDLTVVPSRRTGFFAPTGPTITVATKSGSDAAATTGSVNATNDAIDIYAYGGAAGNVSLVTTGDILAGHTGVYAKDGNTVGAISLTITGNVHAYGGYGVNANRFSAGAGDISVTVGGAVTSTNVGVHTWNFGGSGASGNETISVGGQITSNNMGVSAVTTGTGAISISTAGVNAGGLEAIYASTHGSSATIKSSGDIVDLSGAGVVVQTTGAGSGAVNVTLNGAVTAKGYGVRVSAFNAAGTGAMNVTTKGAVSGSIGLSAQENGSGALTVTTGAVTGASGDGIKAVGVGAGSVSVNASGLVTGATIGIEATSFTGGSVMVTATGGVSAGGDAIHAFSASGPITLNTSGGAIHSGHNALAAISNGNGLVTINNSAAVYGVDHAIYAHAQGTGGIVVNNSGALTLVSTASKYATAIDAGFTAGAVTVYNSGAIHVTALTGPDASSGIYTRGDGVTSIVNHGTIDISGGNHALGIWARDSKSTTTTVHNYAAVNVTATKGAYAALVEGKGAVVFTSTADLTANAALSYGVVALSFNDLVNVSVANVTATGPAGAGIDAEGLTTVTVAAGHVTAGGDAIYAVSKGGANIIINTGALNAGKDGVYAHVSGGTGGVISIFDNGAVSGGRHGVYALNTDIDGSVGAYVRGDVTAATGDGFLINRSGTGGGSLYAGTNGQITAALDGVKIINAGAGAVTVSTAAITAGASGVSVQAKGGGDATITTGALNAGKYGAYARIYGGIGGHAGVTVNGDIHSGNHGVYVTNADTNGSATVVVNGSITATTGYGVDIIRAAAGSGDLSVNVTGAINASSGGVHAWEVYGQPTSGAVSVTVGGPITTNGVGVSAVTSGTGAVSVSTGAVTAGGLQAIYASTHGSSATVKASGDLNALNGVGVLVQATGAGSGGVSVALSGAVNAAGMGVQASETSAAATGAMNISVTGPITAGSLGVQAFNTGSGVTSVSTGAVSATGGAGVSASSAGAITIHTSGLVNGSTNAVEAIGLGGNAISVTATGGLFANGGDAIHAFSGAGDITLTTSGGPIISTHNALSAVTAGAGHVTINNDAAVNSIEHAIYAHAGSGGISVHNTGALTLNNPGGKYATAIAAGFTSGAVSVYNSGAIHVTAVAPDASSGIYTRGDGATSIVNKGTIDISGGNRAFGLWAIDSHSTSTTTHNYGAINASATKTAYGAFILGAGPVVFTSTADITSKAAVAYGVAAVSFKGSVLVGTNGATITATGPAGNGIDAEGVTTVTVVSGKVSAGGDAIYAISKGGSDVTINSGSLVAGKDGAYAHSFGGTNGTISVVAFGSINAGRDGVYALNGDVGGATGVAVVGPITAGAYGVLVNQTGASAGDVSVQTQGAVTAGKGGIKVTENGVTPLGSITVSSVGITAAAGRGVSATTSGSGAVSVTTVGAVQATGGEGVFAQSNGGAVTVSSTGSVSSTTAAGISAFTGGVAAVNVTATGDVSGVGQAINAGTGTGNVTIATSGGTITSTHDGIVAGTGGSGHISVTNSSAINAVTRGVWARDGVGGVGIVNSGAVTLNNTSGGGYATGLVAANTTGAASVTNTGAIHVTTNSVAGAGIYTFADGVSTIVNKGTIDVSSATNALGLWVRDSKGARVDVRNYSDVNVKAATRAYGALVEGQGLVSFSSTHDLHATADKADGVLAISFAGGVNISTTNIYATGTTGHGVDARALGSAFVYTGAIHAGQDGVSATSSGGGAVIVNTGALTVGQDGVYASAKGGAGGVIGVTVDGAINAGRHGVYALQANGDDTLLVQVFGAINAGGAGVLASDTNSTGVGEVWVAATDAINSAGTGISAITAGSGLVTARNTGSITTTGANAAGIYGMSAHGDVAITGVSTHTSGAGSTGLSGRSLTGAVYVTNNGLVATTGAGASGIKANADAGQARVNSTTVTTIGDNTIGIFANGGTLGAVKSGSVTTSGAHTTAILAQSYAGNAAVFSGTVVVNGDHSDGIGAYSKLGSVYVTSTSVTTNGAYDRGIWAHSVDGAHLELHSGVVTTHGANSVAVQLTGGAQIVSTTTTVSTTGANSAGVVAVNTGTTPTDTVTVTSGAVTTTGANSAGIIAMGYQGATVKSGTVTTSGVGSAAIYATSVNGGVSITTTGPTTVNGAGANAITGISTTSGAVTVSNAGVVTDAGGAGIVVQSKGGATVTNTGAITSGGTGIAVNAAGPVSISNSAVVTSGGQGVSVVTSGTALITNTGTISGATGGILASATGGTTIQNFGVIAAGGSGLAVQITGGTVSFQNHGTVSGGLNFGPSVGSTLDNTGTWVADTNTSFGSGATFNNLGPNVVVVAPASSTGTTVAWTGLSNFNNAGGVIDLRQAAGHTGDVFILNGATFTGSTVGVNDSRLFVDARLTSALATDKLVVGQAKGSTTVFVRDLSPAAPGALNLGGVTVIDTTSAAGSEFRLAGGVIDKGFVQYELRFAPAGADFNLVGLPSQEGFEMLKVQAAGQDFARHSTDAWTSRMQEIRDAQGAEHPTRGEGWEVWAQATAGGEQTDRAQTFPVGAFSLTRNLSTDSDWRGFQMGADHLSGDMVWGFTGGVVQQETRFHQDHNALDLEGWNLGAYAGRHWGSFFLNGLASADTFTIDANMHTAPALSHFSGDTLGAKAEAGWRLGGRGFFVEPMADLAWSTTRISDANFAGSGASFQFHKAESLLGSAGVRFGGTWAGGAPYLGVYAVQEFSGDNRMTMVTGLGCPNNCLSLTDKAAGTYGKADFGFTTTRWYGLEGFAKGEALFGGDTSGFAGRVGVRWRW